VPAVPAKLLNNTAVLKYRCAQGHATRTRTSILLIS
jgi:hypothetical protein